MPRFSTLHFVRSALFSLTLVLALGASVHAQAQSTGGTAGGPTTQTTGAPTPATTNTDSCGQQTGAISNPLKYCSLEGLLSGVLKSLITVGSILLTLALVVVGFRFVAARGNEEAIRSARTALMYTIIGGLILLGATAIEAVITSTVQSITY